MPRVCHNDVDWRSSKPTAIGQAAWGIGVRSREWKDQSRLAGLLNPRTLQDCPPWGRFPSWRGSCDGYEEGYVWGAKHPERNIRYHIVNAEP